MKKTLRIVSLLMVVAMCAIALASCGIDSYKKNLEEAGYTVTVTSDEELKKLNEKAEDYEVKAVLVANKDIIYNVTITQYASKKQAEAQAEVAKNLNKIPGVTVKVDGKFVIAGSDSAVKAAMGE